jgi:hypothetical protein
MSKQEWPSAIDNASNEVNGMQVPENTEAAPAEASRVEAQQVSQKEAVKAPSAMDRLEAIAAEARGNMAKSSVETAEAQPQPAVEAGQEAPEKLRGEARGREVLAKAGERVGGFLGSLKAGAGRLWNKMKTWPGKAAGFAAKVIGGAMDAKDFVSDKISADYKLTMERHDGRMEALGNLAEAAKNKLASGIESAKKMYNERVAKFKEILEKRAKMIEAMNKAAEARRQYHASLASALS